MFLWNMNVSIADHHRYFRAIGNAVGLKAGIHRFLDISAEHLHPASIANNWRSPATFFGVVNPPLT